MTSRLRGAFDTPTILALLGIVALTAAGLIVAPALGLAVLGVLCLVLAFLAAR